jgi:hypothetical protein
MFVCCECCVLSSRGLCDGMITRPEESYRLWRVVVCDQEISNKEAKARYGTVENTTKRAVTSRKQTNKHYSAYDNYNCAINSQHNYSILLTKASSRNAIGKKIC